MRSIIAPRWWSILPKYLIGGLVVGLADAQIGRLLVQFGVRPGLATACSVNLLLPVLAIGLALAARRVAIIWLGALAMTVAFGVGLALVHPQARPANPGALIGAIKPVLVLACLGYGLLGTVAHLATRRFLTSDASDAGSIGD